MLKFSGQSRSSEVVLWVNVHRRYQYKRLAYVEQLFNKCDLETASIKNESLRVHSSTEVIWTMTVSLLLIIVDPQANVAPGIPEAAICGQVIAAQYILQFAIVIALCCALHRFASRVIHRSEWFSIFIVWPENKFENLNIWDKTKLSWGDNVSVDIILSAHKSPGKWQSVLF